MKTGTSIADFLSVRLMYVTLIIQLFLLREFKLSIMVRKRTPEEPENHERWLVSYADFITLLFAFFVVMYSVSSVNEGKYRVLSESLNASFRSPNKSNQPIQIGSITKNLNQAVGKAQPSIISLGLANMPPPRFSEQEKNSGKKDVPSKGKSSKGESNKAESKQKFKKISKDLEIAMAPLIKKGLIEITKNEGWVEVEINSNILYYSGSATLSRQSIPVLEKIATILKPLNVSIYVEGFTDNVPISNIIYPSNWELSAARAASVVHLFTKTGVNPKRMAATGFGEYHPLVTNKTDRGRKKNRRVVLLINSDPSPRYIKSKKKTTSQAIPDAKKSLKLSKLKSGSDLKSKKDIFKVLPSPISLPNLAH